MDNTDTVIEQQPEMTVPDTHASGDKIEETSIQEFPDMIQDTPNPDEKKEEKVLISEEECENFYGCLLEAAHGMVATGKGKPHRDIPAERRKAQGKVLHRLIEKYNISLPAEFDLIIMGASVVADWQYMGAGGPVETEQIPEPAIRSEKINPELGGIITDDAKAVDENMKITAEVKLND